METQKLKEILKALNSYSHPSKTKNGESLLGVASDGSRSNPSQPEKNPTELPSDFSLEYHLTVRSQMELSRKQMSLLLSILNYQACHFGLTFGMWLGMEFLMSSLLGKKVHPSDIKEKEVRDTVFVSFLILSAVGGQSLFLNDLKVLPDQLVQKLEQNDLLMKKRVYGSRFNLYRPENLLEISTVPVHIRFDRSKGTSERYSSYCKGYGESHPSAHRQKTKPNSELDGESEDKDFLKLQDLPSLLILTQLEVWTKFHRKQGEKA